MVFLDGYFDESGKQDADKAIVSAGFVSESWDDLNRVWRNRLRRYGFPCLHLSEDTYKADAAHISMYGDFIKQIRMYVDKGFVIAVDTGGFNSLHEDIQRYACEDAHYLALATVLSDVWAFAKTVPNSFVTFNLDDDPSKACKAYQLYNRSLQSHAGARGVFRGISFSDDRHYPQLQAADLLAWVARAEARHRYFGEEFPLRTLYHEFIHHDDSDRLEFITAMWTREHLMKLKPMKKHMRAHHARMNR